MDEQAQEPGKEKTMIRVRSQYVLRLFFVLAIVVVLAVFSAACKKKQGETAEGMEPSEKAETTETPDVIANLKSILGEAEEDTPGAQDIEKTESGIVVYYRFIPENPVHCPLLPKIDLGSPLRSDPSTSL